MEFVPAGFSITGGTLQARERCAAAHFKRANDARSPSCGGRWIWLTRDLTPGMLSADNAEPSSNSVNPPPGAQLRALALRPPSDPGPGRRDFEPRIRDFLHRSRRPATVLVSPIPHERRSLPPLFSLVPTKSSDSRSPRRTARSHLEDLPDSPTPSRDVPLNPAPRHPRPKSRARRQCPRQGDPAPWRRSRSALE